MRARARAMRSEPTVTERKLWQLLRGEKLGVKFRRQQVIGPYIADFACLHPRLIVEADGASHFDEEYDARRDLWFEQNLFRVLRFRNVDILEKPAEVEAAIRRAIGPR
ncbi:MAG: endonuclease domain-containing protein [Proteobacteria bacterium]|nr:endonuclease domain-containing protein [Pseudomonadota bacterium]